jgi:hypothetical protein
MSGWTNYSGIVTSYKMNESEMDHRGSKSVLHETNTVKEQRVDGSSIIKLIIVRCTLIDQEIWL